MIKIEELKKRKKELCYTNEMVAEYSGVPLGTVQKVFSGATKNPRRDTLEALEMALKSPLPFEYSIEPDEQSDYVYESPAEYTAASDYMKEETEKIKAKKIDYWSAKKESSDRWPRQGQYTLEDYYAIPDDVRVELIDGVIYDLATPSFNHQVIQFALAQELYSCINDHDKPCEVVIAPFDVRLDRDDKTMVEPDVMIICDPDIDGNANHLEGQPNLAVEILSPSTREKDCTVKLRKYMNAGVNEYWIVDPEKEKIMAYVFEEDCLPTQYTFDDIIPVGISGGGCSIDFSRIKKRLR